MLWKFMKLMGRRNAGWQGLEEYYRFDRREEEALEGFSLRQKARMADSRLLFLGPQRISDGVAIRHDGRLSAVLKVGSVNLMMATRAEQESLIGAFHGLLRQLPACQLQFKLRVETASLAHQVERLDYAIGRITSPQQGRLARLHRQHLRELERQGLLDFTQYVVISQENSRLMHMEQVYQRETGRQGWLGRDPGFPAHLTGEARTSPASAYPDYLVDPKATPPHKWTGLFQSKKKRAAGAAARKKELTLRARRINAMEQEFYEELQRSIRQLESCVSYLASGLSLAGLSIHRLPDWELLALYAGYLRPELSERTGLAGKREAVSGTPGSFLNGGPPLTSAEFAGGLSGSVIASPLPVSREYTAALDNLARLLASSSINGSTPDLEPVHPSYSSLNSPASFKQKTEENENALEHKMAHPSAPGRTGNPSAEESR